MDFGTDTLWVFIQTVLIAYRNLGDAKNLRQQKIKLLNKKQLNQFFDHCKWFLLTIKLIGPMVGLIIWMASPYFILQKAKVKLFKNR